jgi:hypothetical protein
MFFLLANHVEARAMGRRKMPTRRRSFLSRLVRALPVVLAAAPGVIDAVQQARRALREPAAAPQEPSVPRA